LAIVGPTASGKTCLLNALSGRLPATPGSFVIGHIEYDGVPLREMRTRTAYVLQDDEMFSFLTVREILTLAAHFRLSVSLSKEEIDAAVDSILQELSLLKCVNTLVGGSGSGRRGISGGERRRVMIGDAYTVQS